MKGIHTCITSDLGEAMYLFRWRHRAPKLTSVDIIPGDGSTSLTNQGTENRLVMTFEGPDVFFDHYDYIEGKCSALAPDSTTLSRLFKEILALVHAKKKARLEAGASGHASTKLGTGGRSI
jgi:hypothetical protein